MDPIVDHSCGAASSDPSHGVVELAVTAFGPFLEVAENPSVSVMDDLVDLIGSSQKCKSKVLVTHRTVLRVTPAAVDEGLECIQRSFASTNPVLRVAVHLGVHRGGAAVQIERVAINNLDCPRGDADGRVCCNEAIAPDSDGALSGDSCTCSDEQEAYNTIKPRTLLPKGRRWLTQPSKSFRAAVVLRHSPVLYSCPTDDEPDEDLIDEAVRRANLVVPQDALDSPSATPLILTTSIDAGAYLCNYTLYRSLSLLSNPPPLSSRGPRSFQRLARIVKRSAASDDTPDGGQGAPTLVLFVHVSPQHPADAQARLIAAFLMSLIDLVGV